mmetsp:Transcript_40723/g.121472  ORF Transcript_40723/g.121472 Transcript_40723/m.121472 type:complete len:243 (+) Transcript_40723:2220-2948(+)|eukprot:363622-Chlamydomonas_euryale.AAC.2
MRSASCDAVCQLRRHLPAVTRSARPRRLSLFACWSMPGPLPTGFGQCVDCGRERLPMPRVCQLQPAWQLQGRATLLDSCTTNEAPPPTPPAFPWGCLGVVARAKLRATHGADRGMGRGLQKDGVVLSVPDPASRAAPGPNVWLLLSGPTPSNQVCLGRTSAKIRSAMCWWDRRPGAAPSRFLRGPRFLRGCFLCGGSCSSSAQPKGDECEECEECEECLGPFSLYLVWGEQHRASAPTCTGE